MKSKINNKALFNQKTGGGFVYRFIKRLFDIVFSGVFILVLSPIMILIALAIVLTSKGSPLFLQKRVGKGKKLFTIFKFRTMYKNTAKDVPTHLLDDPDRFLTPIGKVLRKLSLDELPQLFNIFAGQMSFIGPRPALWNQDDLVKLRDRWGANDVRPGLSGWAQINGRDELALPVKARYDGEYVEKMSILFDLKCFVKTFTSVISAKGVKEGSSADVEEKPVKICMVTTIAKAFGWFVSDSAKNFAEKGFDVTVMCGDMDEEFIRKHEKFAKVRPVPLERGIGIKSILKSVKEMKRIFKEEKFDIIQYSTPNAALCCSLCGKAFKKIKIRVYGQWGLRYVGFSGGFKRFFFKRIEKFTCKKATHIISTSPKNMEFAVEEGLCKERKITVIGKGGTIGVDFGIYDINKKDENRRIIKKEYDIPEDTFVFSYIGRLNADKGVGELLTAYKKLLSENPDTRLMLIGMDDATNPVDKELMDWAKESDKVIMTGSVPSQRVAQLMAATDILVHPTYREGFSMVLQEAMAMALPIITTNVPGPSEVIVNKETGILVPDHDAEALYVEMKALMNDTERRKMYSENGRERVERFFARPVMLRNIYTHYCKLLGIDDRHIKLMYLTANPAAAVEAENAGVDRIFLDLEILGKEERQGHLDTVVSRSSLDDIAPLRKAISKSKLLVRCNPVHKGLGKEIDRIIADGADIIMLPYFKEAEEVRTFLELVNARVKTVLLFETAESVENVDEILELENIDEVFVGLNDLHLSYNMDFMFELLADGTVEKLCKKFKEKGIPYGFGGLAKIGEGLLKSDMVIAEHKRLGSTCAILSRTFRNEVDASRPINDFRGEIMLLRNREFEVNRWDDETFEENRLFVVEKTRQVAQMLKEKKTAATAK